MAAIGREGGLQLRNAKLSRFQERGKTTVHDPVGAASRRSIPRWLESCTGQEAARRRSYDHGPVNGYRGKNGLSVGLQRYSCQRVVFQRQRGQSHFRWHENWDGPLSVHAENRMGAIAWAAGLPSLPTNHRYCA